MLRRIAITGLLAGGLLAGAFATASLAARIGGVGGMPGAAVHAAAPHFTPGGAAMHAPHGAGPNAHTRVYGWQGGPHNRHIHHRHGYGVIVGSGYYDGDYDYYGGCEWLHERAVETGSRYWWRRYENCLEG